MECRRENPPPIGWRVPPPAPEVEPDLPAETFLFKLKRLFFTSSKEQKKKKCSKAGTTYQYGCCFSVLVVIFLLSSLGCIIMWFTDIYLDSILNQMTLKEDTEIFNAWRRPPVKPLICVHVFNYTNIDDYIKNRSNKIQVNETGPYCYRETLEKIDINFFDNGTVSYGDRRTHVFERNNSTGSMNDTLIVPNLPLISAIAMTRELPAIAQLVLGTAFENIDSNTMIKVQAHEFLFGYDGKLISLVKGFAKFFHSDLPFERFGILAMRAAETKERITVRTGSDDLNDIGVVTALNGDGQLSAWDDDACNRLDGSDGAFFPRREINQSATLYLFHKDLCRKLPLIYEKEVDFQDGVMGMRFHTPPDVYNTTGTCYCKNGICPPVGVFDVSPCAMGAPIMMSFPHFMNAEPSVTAHLEGLHPDPMRHDFFIDIQPVLGFTLGTVSRIQMNVQIRKSHRMSLLNEFNDGTILPVVWFEVTADRLPPDLFNMIYHASITVQWIQWSLQWGFLGVSVLTACCLLLCRWRCKHDPAESPSRSEQRRAEVVVAQLTSL